MTIIWRINIFSPWAYFFPVLLSIIVSEKNFSAVIKIMKALSLSFFFSSEFLTDLSPLKHSQFY